MLQTQQKSSPKKITSCVLKVSKNRKVGVTLSQQKRFFIVNSKHVSQVLLLYCGGAKIYKHILYKCIFVTRFIVRKC